MLMIFAETLYKLSCGFVAFIGMDVLGSRDQPGPGSTHASALRHGGGWD